jgi:phosphoglycerol transferase MdoB-like AlkP superfamily enzyme
MHNKFSLFVLHIKAIFLSLFVLLVLFFISRLLFGYFLSQTPIFEFDIKDILSVFIMGLRFDLKTGVILLLPFFVFSWLVFFSNKFLLALKYYSLILFLLVIFLNFADFYYFQFYQTHFDNIIFGLFEDDFIALIITIWAQYPVVLLFAITILSVPFFLYLLDDIIYKKPIKIKKYHITLKVFYPFILIVFVLLFARGSVGLFPLSGQDKIVTTNNFLNQLATNPAIELYEAIITRDMTWTNFNLGNILKKYDYTHISQPLSIYFEKKIADNITNKQAFDSMFTTSTAQEESKPNVIMALMESQSGHLIDYHSKNNNLLGELEKHFQEDMLFNRFVSAEHGTHPTLENMLLNTPIYPLGQSQYKNIKFESNVVLPFKRKGYKIVFITGGSSGWRQLNKFLPKQGFDEIIDMVTIKKSYPAADSHSWGLFDEHLFKYAYDLVLKHEKSKNKKPLFVFLLTTGHHPPYKIPKKYKKKPYKIPKSFIDILFDESGKEANDVLQSFQYSNHQLGLFVSKIKQNNSLKNKTIIATAGDHNTRDIIKYSDTSALFNRVRVPFYLYLPSYLRNNITYDKNKLASHKDIFPTIFNRIFKKTKFLNFGNDLLKDDKNNFALHNCSFAINEKGAIKLNDKKNEYYQWIDLYKIKSATKNEKLIQLQEKTRALCALMHWQIAYQVLHS